MPTIDLKPFANDGAANVETQAQFLIDIAPGGSLQHGYVAGTAHSDQVNKVSRQSAIMAAAMANFVSATLNEDVLDDGVLATLIDKLTRAIKTSSFTTGDVKMTLKTAADAGWVLMNDGTIGSGASGANYANNDALALFTLLWNNVIDLWCPVVGGRGGSAAADWAANKKITLPRALGRALAVAGGGAGLSARALAQYLGEETHQLTVAEMPSHNHAFNDITGIIGAGGGGLAGGVSSAANVNIQPAGGDGAHNNMQPTLFLNIMIKL